MKKIRFNIFTAFKYIFLIGVVAVTLIPYIHMVSVSLSDRFSVISNQILLFPKNINLDMYKYVLNDSRISMAYINTLLYVSTGTVISLAVTSMGAYAAIREEMIFRKIYVKLMVICMFFSGGMIPTYLAVKKTGIINTMWGVVLPGAVSMWLFMIMMSFFRSVPKELENSAKIDGVGDIGTFVYIALPLSKAALATIGLFYAVGIWNDFMGPILYLNSQNKYPLTVILRDMVIAGTDMANKARSADDGYAPVNSIKYATLVVSVLPIMCVYPFLQKYFVKGVMVGSIKG